MKTSLYILLATMLIAGAIFYLFYKIGKFILVSLLFMGLAFFMRPIVSNESYSKKY